MTLKVKEIEKSGIYRTKNKKGKEEKKIREQKALMEKNVLKILFLVRLSCSCSNEVGQ